MEGIHCMIYIMMGIHFNGGNQEWDNCYGAHIAYYYLTPLYVEMPYAGYAKTYDHYGMGLP